MIAALLVFREKVTRETLCANVGSTLGVHMSGVVAFPGEARTILGREVVDILVVGHEYIEDVDSMLRECPDGSSVMTVLLSLNPSVAELERARLNGIDVVTDVTHGMEASVARILATYDEFRTRSGIDRMYLDFHASVIWVADCTDREIVEMIAAGYSDREIAGFVCLSHQTVRNRVHRVLCESGARNRTHLAAIYLKSLYEGREPFLPVGHRVARDRRAS